LKSVVRFANGEPPLRDERHGIAQRQILDVALARAVQRQVDRQARDTTFGERATNGVGYSLLPRAEAMQQDDARRGRVGVWQLENSRHRLVAGVELDRSPRERRLGHVPTQRRWRARPPINGFRAPAVRVTEGWLSALRRFSLPSP